jgi:hypothetical protein
MCQTGWGTVPWLCNFAGVVRVRNAEEDKVVSQEMDDASTDSSVWWNSDPFSDPSDSSDSDDDSDDSIDINN